MKDLINQLQLRMKTFLDSIPNLADNTHNGYIKIINDFLTFITIRFPCEGFPNGIKEAVFIAWIQHLNLHYCKTNVCQHARVLSRYLNFLEQIGILKYNCINLLLTQYPRQGLTGVVIALLDPFPDKILQTLRSPEKFISPFGQSIKQYISLGQSQGKRFRNETEVLCRFDQFLMSYKNPPQRLSDSILKKWLAQSQLCQPSTRYLNFMIVRRFCVYLCRFDSATYVPDESLVPSKYSTLLPYVYSKEEIVAILEAAQQLKSSNVSPIRSQTYYMLILLLYTTGLRRGEALTLELQDINWEKQTLHIREGKCFKSRMVPMSTSVSQELKHYIQQRKAAGLSNDTHSPLFQNPHREGHLSKSAVTTTFAGILDQLNIKQVNGRRGPCIHSLRHTMAVHRLEQWYQCGEEVQTKLCLLSTYLGHVNIGHTQRYLTMTTELLQQASQLFNHYTKEKVTGEEK